MEIGAAFAAGTALAAGAALLALPPPPPQAASAARLAPANADAANRNPIRVTLRVPHASRAPLRPSPPILAPD
jgi:hypothetical protein